MPFVQPGPSVTSSMQTDDEARACYICLDEGGELLPDMCACTDRVIHVACLVRWIEQSGKTRCAACNDELRGVSVTRNIPTRTRAKHVLWLVSIFCLIVIPSYFTSVVVRRAFNYQTNGLIAASVFLILYQGGLCLVSVSAWAKMKLPTEQRVHIQLPELRV
jgi:hypothetical protein